MKTLDRTIMVALSLGLSAVSLNASAAAAQSDQASAIANIVRFITQDVRDATSPPDRHAGKGQPR